MNKHSDVLSQSLFEGTLPKAPQLSILVPTYKRGKYLIDALDSIFDQNANDVAYEVVVLNNDPEADMTEAIKRFVNKPIRFLRNTENLGMVGSHNRLAMIAKGEYLAFLHDDDLLLPNYLENFSHIRAEDCNFIVTARYTLYRDRDAGYRAQKLKVFVGRLLFFRWLYRCNPGLINVRDALHVNDNCFGSPSCGTLFRREAFLTVGGFDETIPFAWDMEFFLRVADTQPVSICRPPTGIYRMEVNASARPEVLLDFYSHQFRFQKKLAFDSKYRRYLAREGEHHLYALYAQLSIEAREMVLGQGFPEPKRGNRLLYVLSRIESQLYRLVHNLDFQDPVDASEYEKIRERMRKI